MTNYRHERAKEAFVESGNSELRRRIAEGSIVPDTTAKRCCCYSATQIVLFSVFACVLTRQGAAYVRDRTLLASGRKRGFAEYLPRPTFHPYRSMN